MKHQHRVLLLAIVVGIVLFAAAAGAEDAKKLHLYSWTQYMDPDIIKQFEEKYDVEVEQSYYESLPEMYAHLRAGGSAHYDIVIPSSYYVPRMIADELLQPLDKDLIPNLSNLMDKFSDPVFDPGNQYTAAYQWGTTGIAYNAEMLPEAPAGWAILFDPDVDADYPFVLSTDLQVMLGAACAYQGKPYACTGALNWKQAAQLILKTKDRTGFGGFMDNTPMLDKLENGEVAAGVSYNGDYVFRQAHNPEAYKNKRFILPREGAELWLDSMAIPADAPHPELANKFINFILDAKIGAQLSNYNYYATPNKAAVEHLKPELQQPPVMPSAEQMERLHYTPAIEGPQLERALQIWIAVISG